MAKAYLVYKTEEFETKIFYHGTNEEIALDAFRSAVYQECKQEGWSDEISENTAAKAIQSAQGTLACTYQGVFYMVGE